MTLWFVSVFLRDRATHRWTVAETEKEAVDRVKKQFEDVVGAWAYPVTAEEVRRVS